MSAVTDTVKEALQRLPESSRRHVGEQLLVAGGQGGAGLGNLLFMVVMARVLSEAGFAALAAFLALYLLIHIPAGSLSAGSALDPRIATTARRRLLATGVALGIGLAVAAAPVASLTDLPVPFVLTAAATLPGALLLAVERGRLYGRRSHGRVVVSLLAEPAIRLTAGIALGITVGALGAAAAVIVAGYAALAVAMGGPRRPVGDARDDGALRGSSTATVVMFLLLAVLQNQDVLLANRLLPADLAARFAVLSTLGSVALFAVWNIPLVLMPRASEGERSALPTAVTLAVVVGAGVVGVLLLFPEPIVRLLFGERYVGVAGLAGRYVAAMALLGVGRVLVAFRAALGRTTSTVALVGAVAAIQTVLILMMGNSVRGVVDASLTATATLVAVLGAAVASDARRARADDRAADDESHDEDEGGRQRRRPSGRWWAGVAALTVVGLVVRLLVQRGLWLDEATTWAQVTQPFGAMIEDVRFGDVHPPLYHTVMWAAVRVFGTSELALRLPSIIVGTLLIPLVAAMGRDLYRRRAGMIAAALVAASPLLVWYSQEARMYAFLMFFGVAAVWAQIRAVQHGRALDWAFYALATAALLWTQYFTLLQVAVQQAAFLVIAIVWWRRGRSVRPLLVGWLASTAAIVLALVPLEPILRDQLIAYMNRSGAALTPGGSAVGGEFEGASASYRVLVNILWGVGGYHTTRTMTLLAAAWPLLMLFALVALGRGPWRLPTNLIAAVTVLPFAGLLVLGLLVQSNLFEIRYILTSVPLALLLVARFVATATRGRGTLIAATGALVLLSALGTWFQATNPANPRLYAFRSTLNAVEAEASEGDVLVYEPPYLNDLVNYYAPGVESQPLDEGVPDVGDDESIFIYATFVFLQGQQSVDQVTDAISEVASREDKELVNEFSESNVNVWRLR